MEGTVATKRRPRKTTPGGDKQRKQPTETFMKDAVLLRTEPTDNPDKPRVVLDDLFQAEGITSFRAKAEALNYSSIGALHRAYHGGACSAGLICAIRLRYPRAHYAHIFTEGKVLAERKVPADASADYAA